MKRIVQLALLLALVGGAIFIWRQVFPSPEKQIRKRMADLQKLVSFRSSDGNLAALANLQQLGSLFAKEAEVRLNVQGGPNVSLTGRDSIRQTAGGARRVLKDLSVEFVDVVVTLSEDKRSAVVEATGMARQTENDELWVEELRFKFVKTEDGWLISSVVTVPTLTRRVPGDAIRRSSVFLSDLLTAREPHRQTPGQGTRPRGYRPGAHTGRFLGRVPRMA